MCKERSLRPEFVERMDVNVLKRFLELLVLCTIIFSSVPFIRIQVRCYITWNIFHSSIHRIQPSNWLIVANHFQITLPTPITNNIRTYLFTAAPPAEPSDELQLPDNWRQGPVRVQERFLGALADGRVERVEPGGRFLRIDGAQDTRVNAIGRVQLYAAILWGSDKRRRKETD